MPNPYDVPCEAARNPFKTRSAWGPPAMLVQVRENIVLVGTAHVSEKSVREVRDAIAEHDPDLVAVELDENRFTALTDKRRFEDTPITELLKGGKSFFILAQTLLASFQRRMGAEQGVEPGAEMLAAIEEARGRGKQLVLADRDIGITLKRSWALMGFREKMKLSWEFTKSLVGAEEDEKIEVDEMLEEDVLTVMMDELAEAAPSVSQVLVRERDLYLAKNIHEASKKGKVVAVVGAGHMKGIQQHLAEPAKLPADTKALEVVPEKKIKWGKIIGWGITIAVLGVLLWQLYKAVVSGDFTDFINYAFTWIVLTGGLSALGALLARGHPVSIATAFAAAPMTTLHPALAAGWFAGIVEAKFRTPTVGDFHGISHMQTLSQFWNNRVMRVLLVTAFANIGASVGFFWGGALIASGHPIPVPFT